MNKIPDISALANWLRSWIQPDGSIFGFHNHSVWGDNPYRYGDNTSGHSTFASLTLPALALAIKQQYDERGMKLINKMIEFQTKSFQKNGFYKHIGFQVGEMLKHGLIHNVVPDVALSMTALILKDILEPKYLKMIDMAVSKNLSACDKVYETGPSDKMTGFLQSCCNQDYCRLWARLLHMQAFNHTEWDDLVLKGLTFMIQRFHVMGIPDNDTAGTLRVINDDTILEPAEYYGLMIHPLLLGSTRYDSKLFKESAGNLIKHIIQSTWNDKNDCTRMHRYYIKVKNEYLRVKEPMLIGGMGITLSAIQEAANIFERNSYLKFLQDMDNTYAFYQSKRGFFLAATGWKKECDIIPSSAWQSHDLFYLIKRHGIYKGFWDDFFKTGDKTTVVLGSNSYWIENNSNWALRGYLAMLDANLIGRKDKFKFYIDIPEWIQGKSAHPDGYSIPNEPQFAKANRKIFQISGNKEIEIFNPFGFEL